MRGRTWAVCPKTGRIEYRATGGCLLGIYIQFEDGLYKFYQYDSTGRYTLRGQSPDQYTAKRLAEKLPINPKRYKPNDKA